MAPDQMPGNSSRLKLSMDHGQLPVLGDWLQAFASCHALSPEATFRLDLVLTEAVTNIMDYSRRPGTIGEIELECTLQDGHILAKLMDDGLAYDPTAATPANLPNNLDEARPGGLGIHLMRHYTSCMHYRREHDRNVLSLTLPMEHARASLQ